MTAASRMVVMTMVVVTAMPYAAARLVEVPNETTKAMHATMRAAFTTGM